MNTNLTYLSLLILVLVAACNKSSQVESDDRKKTAMVLPVLTSEPVQHESDDPAIWVNQKDPAKSLILGTDKDKKEGAIYVYDLNGATIEEKCVFNLKGPNNIDIEYGFNLNDEIIDIAVVTERMTNKIRVFRLPEMVAIDNGGIEVFDGEELRAPMGIALYKRQSDNSVFVIVSRKKGPTDGNYLWQYEIVQDGKKQVTGKKVRTFGAYSGGKSIESIAVDDHYGYVYYSDESYGIRKYHADPVLGDEELAVFGTTGFKKDREGISIYYENEKEGYIVVSDQSANRFHVFKREGTPENPHDHQMVKVINTATVESDGSDVTNAILNERFPKGMFVAMTESRHFQFYSWEDFISK